MLGQLRSPDCVNFETRSCSWLSECIMSNDQPASPGHRLCTCLTALLPVDTGVYCWDNIQLYELSCMWLTCTDLAE